MSFVLGGHAHGPARGSTRKRSDCGRDLF